ncbi:hypothetical protein K438DRAFT_1778213 [Mycena galopus ATCC 62051]|nr:hypothetical protein K438DRAFT_1778213 [Mycena galopus ATCC 62051]
MAPKIAAAPQAVKGPPKELIARIEHLRNLLKNLPDSLPENPSDSCYQFYLDEESLNMRSHFGAAGHALELSFDTCHLGGRPIEFHQRGSSLENLTKMLKFAVKYMNTAERESFCEAWIERLIDAAVRSGAKIPAKRRASVTPIDNDASDADGRPAKKQKRPVAEAPGSEPANTDSPLPVKSSSSLPSSHLSTSFTNKKQATLAAFGWKPSTAAQIKDQMREVAEEKAEKREEKKQADERRADQKQEHVRELATLRKRRQRERDRAAVGTDDSDNERSVQKVLIANAKAAASQGGITDVADLSRPATQGWKKHRNGTQGGVVQNVPSQRVFWFHPFLWNLIEAALRRAGWSSAQAVTALRRSHPHLFDSDTSRLHRGTLHKWIVNGERRFTDAALRNISNRRSLVGTGRAGILAAHPEIVASIFETLTGVRASGCVVNVQIACALMIALIQKAGPELLEKFKCSEKFVRAFLESNLDWTMRKGTRASKHIPENAAELCEWTFFRLAYTIENEHVPDKIKARLGSSTLPDTPNDLPTGASIHEEDLDGDIEDVIRDALGDGLPTPARSRLEVAEAIHGDQDSGGLTAGNEDDDIWAYNDQGQKWTEVGIPSAKSGSEAEDDSQEE